MQDSRILKGPGSVPQAEVSPEAAYLAAITSLPRLLSEIGQVLTGIGNELSGINESLDTLALYAERKGTVEKIFRPDDFQPEGPAGGDDEQAA